MSKLASPMIARRTRGGRLSSPFNEGFSVPEAEYAKMAKRNPALESKDQIERSDAMKAEIRAGRWDHFRGR